MATAPTRAAISIRWGRRFITCLPAFLRSMPRRDFTVVEDGDPDPLRPIQEVNPQATPNVAGVIHQAMTLRRKDRPISAAEMSQALRNAAEEDERNAAEEEYARAEERRRLRAEKAAGGEPATKVSEKKPQPRADEPKREEPRAKTGSTAPQPRTPELAPTVVAPTERPSTPSPKPTPQPPAQSTMVAPPPEPVRSAPNTNRAFVRTRRPPPPRGITSESSSLLSLLSLSFVVLLGR